jgi:Thioesterase-like superfamily
VSRPIGLAEILAAAEPLGGGFRLDIPQSWHQGRTAYGGFSSALTLCAAMRAGGDALPPLRSAQVSMIAPLTGTVEVSARVLRRGRNATWMAAEIAGEGGAGFTASLVFMGPADSAVHLNERPVPKGLIAVESAAPLPQGRGVTFLQNHFDVRFALPQRADRQPEMCWWVRARQREGLDPMVEALLIGDALPPGVMPLLPRGAPVSTMHWQVNLLTPAPATTDGWWLLRSAGDYAERGASSQRMDLWNAAGEPVMAGLQSVALFG